MTKDCGQGEDHAEQAHGKKDSLQSKENKKAHLVEDKEDYLTSVWTLLFREKTAPVQTSLPNQATIYSQQTFLPNNHHRHDRQTPEASSSNNICFDLQSPILTLWTGMWRGDATLTDGIGQYVTRREIFWDKDRGDTEGKAVISPSLFLSETSTFSVISLPSAKH